MESMVCTLTEFNGLAHRCQWVASIEGVDWFNDSKGTNVGATLAAIDGIGADLKGKIVLIAGGESKDADFSVLKTAAKQYVKKVHLIGRDADKLDAALNGSVPCEIFSEFSQAVNAANLCVERGDAVLLSPACASFDMFSGFEDRGNQFLKLVNQLEAKR